MPKFDSLVHHNHLYFQRSIVSNKKIRTDLSTIIFELEPYYRIKLSVIPGTPFFWEEMILCFWIEYSQFILSSCDKAKNYCDDHQ